MRMHSTTFATIALGAVVAIQASAFEAAQQFTAALPANWRSSSQVILVLNQVEVPRGLPATLRAYGLSADRKTRQLLGSYGLPAEAPDAQGTRKHDRLPIAITAGLRRWKQAPSGAAKLQLLIEPVDGKGKPLAAYQWKARDATIEVR